MTRYSIRGDKINGVRFVMKCGDCGMPLVDVMEFHPVEACQAFKRTHDSQIVLKEIEPLFFDRILPVITS
jgi:hypothetical protein